MQIRLERRWCKDRYTIGRMYVDGRFVCNTMEPPVVPNEAHPKGAIPAGEYRVEYTWSPRFNRMLPLLCNVPGFTGIRIHAGNIVNDTRGCVLVGKNTAIGWLSSSQATLSRLKDIIAEAKNRKEEVIITVNG